MTETKETTPLLSSMDEPFDKEEFSKYPFDLQVSLFEKELKTSKINPLLYDMADIVLLDSKKHQTYIYSFEEIRRFDYLRYMRYMCHPKFFFDKENFKYLNIYRLQYLYDRYIQYDKYIQQMKTYMNENKFSIMPSTIYMDKESAIEIFDTHMNLYKKLELLSDEDIKNRILIFNKLVAYIDKNLRKHYVKNNKIDYNCYYDDNYTKINLIINNLLCAKPIDEKYLRMKYTVI